VRSFDLYDLAIARILFGIRIVPMQVAAALARRPIEHLGRGRLDDIVRPGTGFHLLVDEPGHAFAAGAAGRFWMPAIPFADVDAWTFAGFAEPGTAKVAWAITVDPRMRGGSWIGLEVRVGFADHDARRAFAPYWFAIGRFSRAIRRAGLAHLRRRLGAIDDIEIRELAGDELIASPRFQATHDVVIEAPPRAVWPWLAQMGADRAGWYSIDRFDNAGRPSARSIHPELQHVAIGDRIRVTPTAPKDAVYVVRDIEADRHLVMCSPGLFDGATDSTRITWAFDLEPIGDSATCLSARVRADYTPRLKTRLYAAAMHPIHGFMERTQLRHLKQRAERMAA
jgi:hypothetical protein